MNASKLAIASLVLFGTIAVASAQSTTGTTNSTIGNAGASTGMNGEMHSTANKKLHMKKHTKRSATGTANSTLGSSGARTGTNGTAHATTNRATH